MRLRFRPRHERPKAVANVESEFCEFRPVARQPSFVQERRRNIEDPSSFLGINEAREAAIALREVSRLGRHSHLTELGGPSKSGTASYSPHMRAHSTRPHVRLFGKAAHKAIESEL